ncbi:MAG: hypothetical protein ACR2G3_01125 [Solirubrobacterales bacterium]
MVEGVSEPDSLRAFAEERELELCEEDVLPRTGALLGQPTLEVVAAATGRLPGGEDATIAHVTYVSKGPRGPELVPYTVAVVRLPSTAGFLPYLQHTTAWEYPRLDFDRLNATRMFAPSGSQMSTRIHDGTSEGLLQELFSPALLHWLARSPDGFGFELDHGVLCASRPGHLTRPEDLDALCGDAARLASALREEVQEEIATGAAEKSAARRSDRQRRRDEVASALAPLVGWESPPPSVDAAVGAYRTAIIRHRPTQLTAGVRTLLIMVAANIIGVGAYSLLFSLGDPLVVVIAFQAAVFAIVFPLVLRETLETRAGLTGTEAFYREYAAARDLAIGDPLTFAATHADAGFNRAPDRVLVGVFAGRPGALALTGDGSVRGDSIALVANRTGPVASATLEAPPPGISAQLLDGYTERLALRLHEEGSGRSG